MSTTYRTRHATALRQLRTAFRDAVIGPDDAAYDTARKVFYSGIDLRPAAIVRPGSDAEVAKVIRIARESGLELAVRSGGHSVMGHSLADGGIVIDLARLRALDIDAAGRTAWAGTGLTAGEYTKAAAEHGLVTGFGDTGSVGIGGITLGGGVGFLHRRYGLTADNLLAAEVVTADGQRIRTDAESHPDLFWALRGGGGNFGVATRFRYRLHEVDQVYGGMMILPATAATIAVFINMAMQAPEELTTIAAVMPAPPMPFIPPEQRGRPILFAMMVYAGPADEGERVLAPFRKLAPPLADMIRPMRYSEIYEHGEPPKPAAIAVRNVFLDGFTQDAAEVILDHLYRSDALMRVAQIRVIGGAVARVPVDATAFAHRRHPLMAILVAAYNNGVDMQAHESWVSEFAARMPRVQPGAYIGFLGNDTDARIREAWPGATFDRLAATKAQYDPDNVFRRNTNIRPAA